MIYDITSWQLPAWATTPEAVAFWYGLALGAVVRIWRAAAGWVKNIDDDNPRSD